jgi:hypothetical protein
MSMPRFARKVSYCIVQKGNGQFYPRYVSAVGSNWFDSWGKAEHNTLEEAKEVLLAFKEKSEYEAKLRKETVVFTLED